MTLAQSDDEGLGDLTPQPSSVRRCSEKTFEEGMALVDETAKYLDGRGREEARDLPRRSRCFTPAKACG